MQNSPKEKLRHLRCSHAHTFLSRQTVERASNKSSFKMVLIISRLRDRRRTLSINSDVIEAVLQLDVANLANSRFYFSLLF